MAKLFWTSEHEQNGLQIACLRIIRLRALEEPPPPIFLSAGGGQGRVSALIAGRTSQKIVSPFPLPLFGKYGIIYRAT